MTLFVFAVAAAIVIIGALGVVFNANPVHSALSLVATLFGVAVLFIVQEAHFLAAVQVIVYAGAIVILFLFVIMLLGIDNDESAKLTLKPSTLAAAGLAGAGLVAALATAFFAGDFAVTGAPASTAAISDNEADVAQLGRSIFTDYVLAFELTAILLTVAVVGAVMLARRLRGRAIDAADYGLSSGAGDSGGDVGTVS